MMPKKLNWWLSFAANVGVIGGLVFLGYEVSQNTSQMRVEAAYSINESLETMNSDYYHDAALVEIMLRGEEDLMSLNPVEYQQFAAYQYTRLNLADYILAMEKEGVSNVHIRYVEFTVRGFRSRPGLREWVAAIEDTWVGSDELFALLSAPEE